MSCASLSLKKPLLFFFLFFRLQPALAAETPTSAMNAILSAGSRGANEKLSELDCDVLRSLQKESTENTKRFQGLAEKLVNHRCNGPATENDSPVNQAADTIDPDQKFQVWDGTALCRGSDERIHLCEHNPDTGRGLFVYSSRRSLENSPSLVCIHFESNYKSPFEREQLIDGRCVVTEFDWRYESARSDVYGIKNWLRKDVNHAALEIPAILKSQCSELFPDAIYCTPTFIVFPESDESRIGVCRLKTHDRVLGIGPILRVGRWNSEWVCESVSMLVPDKDARLSSAERECVPDHLGELKTSFCRYPYLPVARRPIRTFLEW